MGALKWIVVSICGLGGLGVIALGVVSSTPALFIIITARGMGGSANPPCSSMRRIRPSARPAPAAMASALARASATARRSASRSAFARSFRSKRMPVMVVAPPPTAASMTSPTRSTASTRTSSVLRAT